MTRKLFLLAAFLCAMRLEAQKHPNIELGLNPERLYHFTELDSVNLYNGNLVLQLPVGSSYATDGSFGYQLTLVYNGKIWDYMRMDLPLETYTVARPNWRSNAGTGWRVSLGRLISPSDASGGFPSNETNLWIYEDPTGGEHPIADNGANVALSNDKALLRLLKITDSERVVEFPNGDRHSFKLERGRWRLRRMADRFGNYLDVGSEWLLPNDCCDSRESAWVLTDSRGRVHRVNFASFAQDNHSYDRGQHVSSIVLASIGGSATYTFTVEEELTDWGCGHQQPPATQNVPEQATLPLLKQLTLPDGTSYQFTYYTDDNQNDGGPCSEGALESITVPTGGTTTYKYQHVSLPESVCFASAFGQRNPGVKTRMTPDGTWEYLLTLSKEMTLTPDQARIASSACDATAEAAGIPEGGQLQTLYRWSRMTVLSPPFSVHDGATVVSRRIRTDNYSYVYLDGPAPSDPLNGGVNPQEPLTPGAPLASAMGPVTTAVDDASSSSGTGDDRTYLSTRTYDCPAGLADGSCNGGTLLRSTSMRDTDRAYPPAAARTTYEDDRACGTALKLVEVVVVDGHPGDGEALPPFASSATAR